MDPRDPGDRDVEQRVRKALRQDEPGAPSGEAWRRLERRLRREPWRKAGFAGLTLAVVALLAVVVVPRLDRPGDGAAGPPGIVTATPTDAPAPQPAPFPAFYPVTNVEEARRLQDSVDNGHQPLILDPAEVARQFARDYVGWERVQLGTVTKEGSAAAGWKATVELRPYIGEAKPPSTLSRRHVVELIGLKGAEEPTWFVTALRSDTITLDPGSWPLVRDASPVVIKGTGSGFEGTILVRVRDDSGAVLHPRPGRQEGFAQGGAMEPEPFEGTFELDAPKTPAGVLILTNDSAGVGPSPDATIVRVVF